MNRCGDVEVMGNEHLSPIPAPYNKIRVVTCPLQQDEGGDLPLQQDEGGDKTDLIPLYCMLMLVTGQWTEFLCQQVSEAQCLALLAYLALHRLVLVINNRQWEH